MRSTSEWRPVSRHDSCFAAAGNRGSRGPFFGERLNYFQWIGVFLGLFGVALVVWHKIDLDAMSTASLVAVLISLAAITAGTLYQRIFCPAVDLRAASVVQFAATLALVAPLAFAVEGFRFEVSWQLLAAIGFLVTFASIFAVNALHTLMRRGEATRVTSLLYLTPIIAVALDSLMFAIYPTWLTTLGVALTCAGVALVAVKLRDKSELQRPRCPGAQLDAGDDTAAHHCVCRADAYSVRAARGHRVAVCAVEQGVAFTVGVVLALYALVPALLAVRAGRWLDEVGPFRPLLLGTVMMTFGALLPAAFPYATADVAPLLVASALMGTGFMYVQMTMQNLVGIMSEPGSRPAAFSMLALGFSTSGLIAPVASGFLIDSVGHRVTFALVFVLMSASVLILLAQRALLPAPHAPEALVQSRSAFDLLRYPAVRNV